MGVVAILNMRHGPFEHIFVSFILEALTLILCTEGQVWNNSQT